MRKNILLSIRYLFFLFLGLLLAWLSLRNITREEWTDIDAALQHARYFLLVPIIILYLLSNWSRAVRWKILIGSLGYRPSTVNVFFAVLAGYLVNLAIPRLGEVVKCSVLGKHEKMPVSPLLGTILVERAVDIGCLLIVFALAIGLQADAVSAYALSLVQSGARSSNWKGALLLLGVVTLVVVLLVVLFRYFSGNPVVRRIKAIAIGIWEGVAGIRKMENKGWFVFHTVLIWCLYYICTRLGLYALKELDGIGPAAALSVLGVGSIGMVVTPGGIGAYQYLVQKILVLYGVSDALGKAAGWVLWLVPTIVLIVGGMASFLVLTPKRGKEEKL